MTGKICTVLKVVHEPEDPFVIDMIEKMKADPEARQIIKFRQSPYNGEPFDHNKAKLEGKR